MKAIRDEEVKQRGIGFVKQVGVLLSRECICAQFSYPCSDTRTSVCDAPIPECTPYNNLMLLHLVRISDVFVGICISREALSTAI